MVITLATCHCDRLIHLFIILLVILFDFSVDLCSCLFGGLYVYLEESVCLSVCPSDVCWSLPVWLSVFICLSVCLCVCEGESAPFQSLASLVVGVESCIVGTLFKRMDLKPSILKAVTQEVSQQAYCVCLVVMLYCNPSIHQ